MALSLKADKLPVEQVTSSGVNEPPGSSEKVNVISACSPALRVVTVLVIVTVGRLVS